MNHAIIDILEEFNLAEYMPIIPRELDLGEPLLPRRGNLVKVITGMRRSGKTYRLFQVMQELQASGVSADVMLYFNFEDDRLGSVTPQTGDEVLEAFFYLRQPRPDGLYLFFDEIQEMKNWGKWLRRIVDTVKATIYVTGSSSKMLSADVATEFRGRSIEFVQYPLSFREYVSFHEPALNIESRGHSLADRGALKRLFDAFLLQGGFPAVQSLPASQAVSTLQGYAQRVVARDVLERHNLGNPQAVYAFSRKVLALNGRRLSVRKIANELSSSGLKVGRETIAQCLAYFEDAFLVLPVRERTRSLGELNQGLKAYPVDVGLARANSPASANDQGQSLESAVCVELMRRYGGGRSASVSYMKTAQHGLEVDFSVGDVLFGDETQLFQVTWSFEDPKTLERETKALWEAMEELHVQEAVLIVGDGSRQTLEKGEARIKCIPAAEWFLGNVD
ncbi:AAA family ATPase [Eggerthellaceae bacterium zg-886]|uniref:AAA family ATPase n=2 Tax=Xiamenia xianingshaonis TaxID=2682776 RepID=A0ABX0ILW8_9ACTN|nr:AAA family ATPase [Xiamenia xianingshaonis]